MSYQNLCLLIPALDPDTALLTLVKALKQYDFNQLIIVNDGSTLLTSEQVFAELEQLDGIKLLKHEENLGKGAALKTGLKHLAQINPHDHIKGVVCLDADGQHKPQDVIAIADELLHIDSGVVLGTRRFDTDVPLRSQIGNHFTRYLFKYCYRINIRDTQTGLRAINSDLFNTFSQLPYDRFEYELQCLIYIAKKKVKLVQHDIATVYLEENKSSHFRPVRDSICVIGVLLKGLLNPVD